MRVLIRLLAIGKISLFLFLSLFHSILSQDLGFVSLTEQLQCFEDVNREWEFIDYAHSAKTILHKASEQKEFSLPFTKSQHYCYIQIPNQSFDKNLLVIESSLHDYLDAILKDQYSNYKLMKGGDRVPNLHNAEKLFPRALDLAEERYTAVFFRFDSYDGYFPNTTIRLWDSWEIQKFQSLVSSLNRIILGGLASFFLISFFVFLQSWDNLFGFFSGYMLSVLAVFMIGSGLLYQMGIVSSFLQNEGLLISSCFTVLFLVGVSFEFLNINLVVSKSKEIYFGIVALILFLAVNFNDYSESFFFNS